MMVALDRLALVDDKMVAEGCKVFVRQVLEFFEKNKPELNIFIKLV